MLYNIEEKPNPKRLQRKIEQETKDNGIGTKAQQAMKLSQELLKMESKKNLKLKRELSEEQRFLQKQLKKKEKNKGH